MTKEGTITITIWLGYETKKKRKKIGRRKRVARILGRIVLRGSMNVWWTIGVCTKRSIDFEGGGEGDVNLGRKLEGRRREMCIGRGRKLDKMDDNRHFDSGGTQPSAKCMQRDLHLDALSIKSRVIRDHLGAHHRSLTNERYRYLMPPFNRLLSAEKTLETRSCRIFYRLYP